MKHEKEDIEKDEQHDILKAVMIEMLLRAVPKSVSTEAITQRMENPTEVMLLVMDKVSTWRRKRKGNDLNQRHVSRSMLHRRKRFRRHKDLEKKIRACAKDRIDVARSFDFAHSFGRHHRKGNLERNEKSIHSGFNQRTAQS